MSRLNVAEIVSRRDSCRREMTSEQIKVEDWWLNRFDAFTREQKDAIADAYREHIIGADRSMSQVHAGFSDGRNDRQGFYRALRDSLSISPEDISFLSKAGDVSWGGLMFYLEFYGVLSEKIYAIGANMHANK